MKKEKEITERIKQLKETAWLYNNLSNHIVQAMSQEIKILEWVLNEKK